MASIDGTARLWTAVAPAQADHSFSGVMFDVEALGNWEVTLTSVWLAGQLGSVSVFAASGGWCSDDGHDDAFLQQVLARCGWGSPNDVINPSRWELVAQERRAVSWSTPVEIRLTQAVRVLPGRRVGIYCHSDAPNDGGLIYHSCGRASELAASEHVRLLPGLGHTSAVPFDVDSGWWAASLQRLRGPAGALSYGFRRRYWSATQDSKAMPRTLRAAARVLLLCQARGISGGGGVLGLLSKDIVTDILERFVTWDWFEPCPNPQPMDEDVVGTDTLANLDSESTSSSGEECAEDVSAQLIEAHRLAWRAEQQQLQREHRSERERRGKAHVQRGGHAAAAEARRLREERKSAKQGRREVQRRAKAAWNRGNPQLGHVERMAAAHMATRQMMGPTAVLHVHGNLEGQAQTADSTRPAEQEQEQPPLEPEPEPFGSAASQRLAESSHTRSGSAKVRLTVLLESAAETGKRISAKRGKGGHKQGGGKRGSLTLVVARTSTVEQISTIVRQKLREGKKARGQLMIQANGPRLMPLTNARVRDLSNGAQVRWCRAAS
jgi:hypothetical protein